MFGWFTRERILAIISILAFIMSLLSWIHMWLYQRRKLKISILKYYRIFNSHYFLLSFENHSRIPILISRIKIIQENENNRQCSLTSTVMIKSEIKRKNGDIERNSIHTVKFPISIGSLSGTSEFIAFEENQDNHKDLPNELIFQVCTNRGKAFQTKFLLPVPSPPEELI